ncbi:ankyrin repeat domain-containing protein [Thiotrichales bacterium 19S11-10]|nr:ankyrin repeat domain-containing protein [Thiotrichales bacterium 19S11-10]
MRLNNKNMVNFKRAYHIAYDEHYKEKPKPFSLNPFAHKTPNEVYDMSFNELQQYKAQNTNPIVKSAEDRMDKHEDSEPDEKGKEEAESSASDEKVENEKEDVKRDNELIKAINDKKSASNIKKILNNHENLWMLRGKDKEGNTALHLLIAYVKHHDFHSYLDRDEIARLLISRMTLEELNIKNNDGKTILHLAAEGRDYWVVKNNKLLDKVNVNMEDNSSHTALYYLMSAKYYTNKDFMIENFIDGMSIDALKNESQHKKSALFLAIRYGDDKTAFMLLEEFNINNKDDMIELQNILSVAAYYARGEIVHSLLGEGVKPIINNENGNTILHDVLSKELSWNRSNLAKDLIMIEPKDALNHKNTGGNTPLHLAIINDDSGSIGSSGHGHDVVKALLQQGADPTIINKKGCTPLHYAAVRGNIKIVNLLLKEENIEINTVSKGKLSALHFAARQGHVDVVKSLIDSGADFSSLTEKGNTPLHITLLKFDGCEEYKKQRQATALYLISKMMSHDVLNIQNADGNTALHLAVLSRDEKVVKALLDKGVDFEIQNEKQETAYKLAGENNPIAKTLSKAKQRDNKASEDIQKRLKEFMEKEEKKETPVHNDESKCLNKKEEAGKVMMHAGDDYQNTYGLTFYPNAPDENL